MAMKTKFYSNTVIAGLAALSFILQVIHFGIASNWGMWIDFVAVPWLIAFFLLGAGAAFTTSIIMLVLISLVAASGVIGAIMKFTATLPMFIIPAMLLFRRKTLMVSAAVIIIFTVSLSTVFTHGIIDYQPAKPGEAVEKEQPITENLKLKISMGGLKPAKNMQNAASSIIIIVAATAIMSAFLAWSFKTGETRGLDFFANPANMLVGLALAVIVRGLIACIANYYFAIPAFFGMTTEQALGFIPWPIMFGMNAVQGAIEYVLAWALVYKTHIRERFGA